MIKNRTDSDGAYENKFTDNTHKKYNDINKAICGKPTYSHFFLVLNKLNRIASHLAAKTS